MNPLIIIIGGTALFLLFGFVCAKIVQRQDKRKYYQAVEDIENNRQREQQSDWTKQ